MPWPQPRQDHAVRTVAACGRLNAPACPMPPALQIDKDEVRLRRSIGAKKDEYTLDRKHIT